MTEANMAQSESQVLVEHAAWCLPRYRVASPWIGKQARLRLPGGTAEDTGVIVEAFQAPGVECVYLVEINGRPDAPEGRGYHWASPAVACYAPGRWILAVS